MVQCITKTIYCLRRTFCKHVSFLSVLCFTLFLVNKPVDKLITVFRVLMNERCLSYCRVVFGTYNKGGTLWKDFSLLALRPAILSVVFLALASETSNSMWKPLSTSLAYLPYLPACSPHCRLNPIIIWIKSHTRTLTNHLPLLSETPVHLDHPSGSSHHF